MLHWGYCNKIRLIGAIILTISMGIVGGCSAAKVNTEEASSQSENETTLLEQIAGTWRMDAEKTDPSPWGTGISAGSEMVISTTGEFSYYIGIGGGGTGQCEAHDDGITVEIQPYEEHSSEKEILTLNYVIDNGDEYILMKWQDIDVYWKREITKMLTYSKEGETEQKKAVLITGEGYSIYLPDGEWRQSDLHTWMTVVNENVQLWISHVQDKTIAQVTEQLSVDGYGELENNVMTKNDGEMVYKVQLNEVENDVWEVFYCYPAEAEEGWGRELPVIADTFMVSAAMENE